MRFLKAFLVCMLLPALCFAEKLPPIDLGQAIKLVELKTGHLTPTSMPSRSSTAFLNAKSSAGAIEAVVNLNSARVMSIKTDGKETYVFPGVVAVGHRGTVKFAPENTIAAFNKALELGADLVEMDVRESKDGQLIIMHDMNIGRTTTGKGDVAELTLEQIQKFEAGSKFDSKFTGEPVPTFASVLDAIKGRGLPDIDFKAGDPQKVIDAVRAAGLIGKCTLYCGDSTKLRNTLDLEKGFIIRPTALKGLEGLDAVIAEFDPPIVNIDWVDFSEAFVREIHLRGKLAFVNTMGKADGKESIKRAVNAGADYIQTDYLDVLLPLLRAERLHK